MGRKRVLYDDKQCPICKEYFPCKNKRDYEIKKTCSKKCATDLMKLNSLVEGNCKICNKIVETNKSSAMSGVYCSDECRKFRYKKECETCKNDFFSPKNDAKYCSDQCMKIGLKNNLVEIKCSECGEEFSRPSFTVASDKKVFCSRKCSQRNFSKNHPNRYGSKWGRIRERKVKADDYTCQICNKQSFEKYALNVHHIIPIEMFDDIDDANEMSNLQTLCYECHMELHEREINT